MLDQDSTLNESNDEQKKSSGRKRDSKHKRKDKLKQVVKNVVVAKADVFQKKLLEAVKKKKREVQEEVKKKRSIKQQNLIEEQINKVARHKVVAPSVNPTSMGQEQD